MDHEHVHFFPPPQLGMTWAAAFFWFFIASPVLIPLMIIAPLWAAILVILAIMIVRNIRWIMRILRALGQMIFVAIGKVLNLV